MADDFIPRQDANALLWMQAFSAGISANPAVFSLNSADATALSAAVASYSSALALATSQATRTPPNVSLKDQTRNSAEAICRQYAILIKYNNGISDQAKIDIGVRPVNHDHDAVPTPTSSPMLNIVGCTPGSQTLRYADSTTPDSGAKPPGAIDLLLFRKVEETASEDYTDAMFLGKFTKNPVGVAFDPGDNKKIATYWGRWSTRTGLVGPWSLPVSMAIAA